MIKIFTADRAPSSYEVHTHRILEKRRSALSFAADGEFYLSIAVFRESFNALRKVPIEHDSHEDLLQKILGTMTGYFEKLITQEFAEFAAATRVMLEACADHGILPEQHSELLETHFANMRILIDASAFMGRASLVVENMCMSGCLDDDDLGYLEHTFQEAFGNPLE